MPDYVWSLAIGLLIAIAAFIAVPSIKSQRDTKTMEYKDLAIAARDTMISDLRADMAAMEERCKDREHQQEKRHGIEIAKINSRLDAMTPEFAHSIGVVVAAVLKGEDIGVVR